MGAITGINWTDSTFNPWQGCTKVSPACDHCYAERQTKRFGKVKWGAGQTRLRTSAKNWALPKKWNDQGLVCVDCGQPSLKRGTSIDCKCGQAGAIGQMRRRRVFSASWADWLDNEVPIAWFVDLMDLVRCTPNLDWQLLTKRIGNFRNRMTGAINWAEGVGRPPELVQWMRLWSSGEDIPRHIWIGATIADQEELVRDIHKLLAVPAWVRFLSVEPMLSELNFVGVFANPKDVRDGTNALEALDWIICGGESGPQARPMHPGWVRSLRDQCAAASVPFFMKQWGEWGPYKRELMEVGSPLQTERGYAPASKWIGGGLPMLRYGRHKVDRLLDGVEHNGFPPAKMGGSL